MKFTGPVQLIDAFTKYRLQERRAVKLVQKTKTQDKWEQVDINLQNNWRIMTY